MKSVEDAVKCIRSGLPGLTCPIGIITGSGWNLSGLLANSTEINYRNIRGFPAPSVAGHKGSLVHGFHEGREIILLQGRVHYYEGYSMEEVAFPVRVLSALGIRTVILTNAAGGIRQDINPGEFMVVSDHVNLMGVNPLRAEHAPGAGDNSINGFTDMSLAYDPDLADIAVQSADATGVKVHLGVLAAVAGPSYETPAEIRMLRVIGADAVCMSTIPEVIMSRSLGMMVLAISLITNYAAGVSRSALRHEDVVAMADRCSREASRLISSVIANMPR